jgi:MFS transporter, CP family, cyanate transporter
MPATTGVSGLQREDRVNHPEQPRMPMSQASAPAPAKPEVQRARPAWSLMTMAALGGIMLMALNLRAAVTALPPLIDQMRDDVAFSPVLIGLLGSLAPLAFASAGLLGTLMMRHLTAERIAVLLLLVTAAGQLARPWSPSAAVFLSLSGVTLLSMGVGNVIMPALVKAWFPHRIGPVTAGYTTMLAVGTAVPALIAIPLAGAVPALGWRLGLGIWGVTALLAIPAWLIASRQPRALPPPRPVEGRRLPEDTGPQRIPVHRSMIAWGLGMLFIGNSLNLYAMFTWLPIRLVDAGLSEAAAGAQLAVLAGVGIVPSLLVPGVAARFGHTFGLTALCAGCFAVGYAGLLLVPATATTVWTITAGLGGGGFPLVLTMIGLRSATPATAGVLSAFVQTVGYTGAITGPLAFGLLHGATGGWTASFGFLLLTLLVMLTGGWLTRRPTTVDDDLRCRAAQRAARSAPGTLPG